MKTHLVIAGILLALSGGPALAYCPSQPDSADSRYVEKMQQRALCLNRQLADQTKAQTQGTQFDALSDSVQDSAIQRRFDMLPPVRPTWDF